MKKKKISTRKLLEMIVEGKKCYPQYWPEDTYFYLHKKEFVTETGEVLPCKDAFEALTMGKVKVQ